MKLFQPPMATWIIEGPGSLPPLYIRARTFDEALAKARLRDPDYCSGRVVNDDWKESAKP